MRKPIGITVPYREVGYKEDPIKVLEEKVKALEKRVEQLEKQRKEK
jgi:polyhydroxyalkanoate synthesis regulator phasin